MAWTMMLNVKYQVKCQTAGTGVIFGRSVPKLNCNSSSGYAETPKSNFPAHDHKIILLYANLHHLYFGNMFACFYMGHLHILNTTGKES